jgi:O-antigen ligase
MLEGRPPVSFRRSDLAHTSPAAWVQGLYVLAAALDAAAFLKVASADPLASVGGVQSVYEPALLAMSTVVLFVRLGGRVPWRLLLAGPLLSVGVYSVYSALSAAWSLDPVLTIGKSLELGLSLVNATLLVSAVHRDGWQHRLHLYLALAILLAAGAFLVVNQVMYGTPLRMISDQYDTRERLWLAYTHPLTVADLAALGLLCALVANVRVWVKTALVLAFAWLMYLTLSRGSTVGLGLAILTYLIVRKQTGAALQWRFAFVIALGVFVLGGVVAMLASDSQYLADLPPEVMTLNGRLDLWATALDFSFADTWHTVFGYGYFASRFVLLDSFDWGGHSHQVVLEILLTTGVLGLLIFAYFLQSVVRMSMRDASLLTLTAYVIVVGIDDPILFQPGLPMTILMCCIAHVLEQRRHAAERQAPLSELSLAARKMALRRAPGAGRALPAGWGAAGARADSP